jgi:hypothetical protein
MNSQPEPSTRPGQEPVSRDPLDNYRHLAVATTGLILGRLLDQHRPDAASITLNYPAGHPELVDAAARAAGIPLGIWATGHGVDVHVATGTLAGGAVTLTLMCRIPAETLAQRHARAAAELALLDREIAANGTREAGQ